MSLNKKLSLRNNCICMYCMFSLHGITQFKMLFSLLSSKLLKKHSNVHKETHEDLSSIFSVRPKLFHVGVIMILDRMLGVNVYIPLTTLIHVSEEKFCIPFISVGGRGSCRRRVNWAKQAQNVGKGFDGSNIPRLWRCSVI